MATYTYSIAEIGAAGMMPAGWYPLTLLVQVGKYWLPAVAGIGKANLMAANYTDQGAALRQVQKGTLRIEDAGLQDVPTASFAIAATPATAPKDGEPVVIAIGTLQQRLFGGYLTNPTVEKRSTNTLLYQCTAEGWNRDLQKRLVSGSWSGEYAGNIIEELITTYTPQFFIGSNVELGAYIEEFTADYQSLLSICNQLASVSDVTFYIAPSREIFFQRQTAQTAAWEVNTVEPFQALQISEDSSQLINRVLVRYSALQIKSDSFDGDGETEEFQLGFVPHTITSLQVNGSDVTFGTHYKEDNETNDFSIDFSRGIIKTRDHPVLEIGDTLSVVYTAKIPAILEVNYPASQTDRAEREGGDGIYDLLLTDREILSLADARAQAIAELTTNAWPKVTVSYTRMDYVQEMLANRLRVGQQQRINIYGYDVTLTIEQVTLSLVRRAESYLMKWQQEVSLGPITRGLETVLQSLSDTAVEGVKQEDDELISLEDYIP